MATPKCHLFFSFSLFLVKATSTNTTPTKHKVSGFYSGLHKTEVLQWVVKIDPYIQPQFTPDEIAFTIGLHNEGPVIKGKNMYLFTHELHKQHYKKRQLLHSNAHHNPVYDLWPSKHLDQNVWEAYRETVHKKLESEPQIVWYMQQFVRSRKTRSSVLYNDPAYSSQWHLHNSKHSKIDLQVVDVWEYNITGTGVTAAVLDDGLEWNHPDFKDNYCAKCSYDLNDKDPDPSPSRNKDTNHHGTRCAGEIAAAADNDYCGVGLAHGARIAGLRILGGPMTDSLEASAFTTNMEVIDVYSCSWGPDDDGETVDGPHYLAEHAMEEAVNYGRNGYGNIFVVASGNGGLSGDNCNFDGYATSIYTVTIGAVDEAGEMPYYAEECASMLAVTFSSGSIGKPAIVTTDWFQFGGTGCTSSHSGTSAAAPLAAGMIALMLQVQPCLTWRDVQHIIVISAVKVDINPGNWQRNAAGLHHSHKHGFGLMNAWKLVNAAKIWEPVPWYTTYLSETLRPNVDIPPKRQLLTLNYTVSAEKLESLKLYSLEYVHVKITIKHQERGRLEIKLTCPSGTLSVLAATRDKDKSQDGFQDWIFSTVRCWGEPPEGQWKLTVQDHSSKSYSQGQVVEWQLRLYGTSITPEQFKDRIKKVKEAEDGKYLDSNITMTCLPPPAHKKPRMIISEKTVKILTLTGAFCLVMALYETLEYMLCNDDDKKAKRKRQGHSNQQTPEEQETSLTEDVDEETQLLTSDVLAQNSDTQNALASQNAAVDITETGMSDNQNPRTAGDDPVPSTTCPDSTAPSTVPPLDNILMHVPKQSQYVAMELFDGDSDEEDDLLFSVTQRLLPDN